jgi:hypothetical protein
MNGEESSDGVQGERRFVMRVFGIDDAVAEAYQNDDLPPPQAHEDE